MTVVLSLFDGISCARLAMIESGLTFDTFVSVEINPKARKVTSFHFPDTIHLCDVRRVSYRDGVLYYDDVEVVQMDPASAIVLGGSPCQGFSNAGKKLNFNDERSKLFFEFERIVKQIQPHMWLLENVRMKRQWVDIISKRLGRPPVCINSKVFTPLSRPRIYWCNWDISEPIPSKSLGMKDLFDTPENVEKYRVVLSEKALAMCHRIVARAKERGLGYKMPIVTGEKHYLCLDKNIFKGPDGKRGIVDDGIHALRMPTPLECERLQGLPDNYTMYEGKGIEMCKTNRLRLIGNAWTVPVVTFLLKNYPIKKK